MWEMTVRLPGYINKYCSFDFKSKLKDIFSWNQIISFIADRFALWPLSWIGVYHLQIFGTVVHNTNIIERYISYMYLHQQRKLLSHRLLTLWMVMLVLLNKNEGHNHCIFSFHISTFAEEWKAQFIKRERNKLMYYKTQVVRDVSPLLYCPFAGYFVEAHPSDQ